MSKKKINIVTCLAIDQQPSDHSIKYKAIGRVSRDMKRKIYWRLVYVYFAISVRNNPHFHHIFFTNDQDDFVLEGFNFSEEVRKLGVEIRFLPFTQFYIPAGHSKLFKNAYYKFEVFRELASEQIPSVYTDIDCIWVRHWQNLTDLLDEYDILIYDVYERSDKPHIKHPNNTSMKEMGDVFRSIDSDYPSEFPIWYGGEFLGAKPEIYNRITHKIEQVYRQILGSDKESFLLPNGESMLDGDEYLSTYVYNYFDWKVFHVNSHIRRVWTQYNYKTTRPSDMDLCLWHLPAEKLSGFPLVFKRLREKSTNELDYFGPDQISLLANYLGITSDNKWMATRRTYEYIKNKVWGIWDHFWLKN